jgi:hypothetical protein
MGKALAQGNNGEPPAIAPRLPFHDLRAKFASDKKTLEEATALLGHAGSTTSKTTYRRKMPRARLLR